MKPTARLMEALERPGVKWRAHYDGEPATVFPPNFRVAAPSVVFDIPFMVSDGATHHVSGDFGLIDHRATASMDGVSATKAQVIVKVGIRWFAFKFWVKMEVRLNTDTAHVLVVECDLGLLKGLLAL